MKQLYMAPLEGITTYIYRNAHAKSFGRMDKYFTPFLSPAEERSFTEKEIDEILPSNNQGLNIVPQLMIARPDLCIRAVKELETYGFSEVNLNFGCPSGIVVKKGKGSGMLKNPESLERFLCQVFDGLFDTDIAVSVKTRIGMSDPKEAERLCKVYTSFPISELTVHPRVRDEFYKGPVHLDAFEHFEKAFRASKTKLVYNGNIFSENDAKDLSGRFPTIDTLMLGRGLIADPTLANRIRGEEREKSCFDFLLELENAYKETIPYEKLVLDRMKRLWTYMKTAPQYLEKQAEILTILQAGSMEEYDRALAQLKERAELFSEEKPD